MRHKVAIDRAVGNIAGKQHGVVSTRQLLAAGLSRSGVARRVREGRLHRIHRGVYAVGHRALSHEARWMAAVLACGTGGPRTPPTHVEGADSLDGPTLSVLEHWGAALSHRSAAELWGLLPARSGLADVSVFGDGGPRIWPFAPWDTTSFASPTAR
jgi:Transcriptional regulator, AbiEi antitoxin